MRLKKQLANFVARERVCRVATVGEGARPHLVPVCHVLADGKLYFGSGSDARKVMNVKTNSQVAVTVDLYSDDWSQLKGVMLRGSARLVRRGREFQRVRAMLYAKYLQYSVEAALDARDSVIVEVTPTAVFPWGFE
jgi:nitroimidazol reductase NimA-like FMN-containing flavoprotein (pyridoxamine 5'-phosphate oxidase superfamily)